MENNKYADMLSLPRHISEKRAPMSMTDRAAQFSPFAALTGYEDTIRETARLTDQRIELDESALMELNEKLVQLNSVIDRRPEVTIVCFTRDGQKTGGAYLQISGCVKKLDQIRQELVMTDDTVIPMEDLYDIQLD